MKNKFLALPEQEQAVLIRQTARQLDMPEMIIEKDFWICWCLEKIFALPIKMAFKGGTSLSKVFGLINRFSEDCDITIDYRSFKPTLTLAGLNRSQLKKESDHLRMELKNYISQTALPYLKNELEKTVPNKNFEITISDDGEQLRIYYPSVLSQLHGYLRDHVFLEFGVRNSTEPCEQHPITPYLAQEKEELALPSPLINTLSPMRTFWEKATLMHVECHRDRFIKTPERLSRHWYDLLMLNNSWVGAQALSRHDILESVVDHKKAFFNASYANYDDCLSGKFRLIPGIEYLKNLKQDFSQMMSAGMFHEEPPTFDNIVIGLRDLEEKINMSYKVRVSSL